MSLPFGLQFWFCCSWFCDLCLWVLSLDFAVCLGVGIIYFSWKFGFVLVLISFGLWALVGCRLVGFA